jgi:hypothetical protein
MRCDGERQRRSEPQLGARYLQPMAKLAGTAHEPGITHRAVECADPPVDFSLFLAQQRGLTRAAAEDLLETWIDEYSTAKARASAAHAQGQGEDLRSDTLA